MSERTHSPSPTAAERSKPRSRMVLALAGTALAVLIAGIAFQVFRADEAMSVTRPAGDESAGTASVSGTSGSGTTLALVNNEPVSWDLVAEEAIALHGREVLENLINRMVIQQECERRGVAVTHAEVQQEVVRIASNFNLTIDTWYQMISSERGMSAEQYHRDVIWPMLALKKLAGTDITVTPEELQRAFERDFGERVNARMIVIEGNVRHATQVWEEAKANPDSFPQLAQQYSADPNSRALGGVVPAIRRHSGMPNIERAAFALRDGEISPVIQVGRDRYVIIRSEGRTQQVVTDISQVQEELTAQLIEEKTQQAIARVFEEIQSSAVVHNYLTGESQSGSQFSPGGAIQQTGGTQVSSGSPAATAR